MKKVKAKKVKCIRCGKVAVSGGMLCWKHLADERLDIIENLRYDKVDVARELEKSNQDIVRLRHSEKDLLNTVKYLQGKLEGVLLGVGIKE